MGDSSVGSDGLTLVIRWMARAWSIVSIGFVLLMVMGEVVHPHAPAPTGFRDLLGLFFFPFGVCLGMVMAWRWEGLGGGIAVGSLLAFYAALRIMGGRFPRGPYFVLIAAPGFLFLLSWGITLVRRRGGHGDKGRLR